MDYTQLAVEMTARITELNKDIASLEASSAQATANATDWGEQAEAKTSIRDQYVSALALIEQ